MDHFYYSAPLPGGATLCLTHLTDFEISLAVEEITDPSGYYLFEKHERNGEERVQILARAQDDDAVLWLRDRFEMI